MKKVINKALSTSIIFCFLIGCSTQAIGMDSIEPEYQGSSIANTVVFAGKENSFYVISWMDPEIYYVSKDLKKTDLGTLIFADDKQVKNLDNYRIEKYSDEIKQSAGVYQYNDKMYYISNKVTKEMELSYGLIETDLKFENRKKIMNLDYEPDQFIMQNGYVLIAENSDKEKLHVYDNSLKEVCNIQLEGKISDIFAISNKIYIDTLNIDQHKTCTLNLNTMDIEQLNLDDHEIFLYANEEYYATRTYNKSLNEANANDIIHTSKLYAVNNEELLNIDNEIIGYFDDQYIYTTAINSDHIVYRIYDYDLNLIKEITPSDYVQGNQDELVLGMDFECNLILRVINGNIISDVKVDDTREYFGCSVDTGICKMITE